MKLGIKKINDNFTGRVIIGGSKSISNRLAIIRSLANSDTSIKNLSDSNDTVSLVNFLTRIVTCEKSGVPMIINVDNAGTVARFLTAYLAYREGTWLITGSDRMKERPMKGLIDALISLGANITYTAKEGYLPIKIIGSDIEGREVEVDATSSSQFISALMMIGPFLENGLTIKFTGKPVSFSYIKMTSEIMKANGAKSFLFKDKVVIENSVYKFQSTDVEPDWSSASYWYEMVALSNNSEVFLPGFKENSLQGDSVIADIYNMLGVKTLYQDDGIIIKKQGKITSNFSYDFSGIPDLVPAVMTTCAALGISSEFRNINQLVYKESNRIDALGKELSKIGARINRSENSYILSTKKVEVDEIAFDTYNDHRMAMCLTPLVLIFGNIEIENPEIVNKSYPGYWNDIKNLNFAQLISVTS